MTSYIHLELRRLVEQRAEWLCEYCLVGEDDTHFGCQVDHILSEKRGGATVAENLAYACVFCNRNKGSDIGSIIHASRQFERFFNPRLDVWADHFRLEGSRIIDLSGIGQVTVRILRFNDMERIAERELLGELGVYPSEAARRRIEPKDQ